MSRSVSPRICCLLALLFTTEQANAQCQAVSARPNTWMVAGAELDGRVSSWEIVCASCDGWVRASHTDCKGPRDASNRGFIFDLVRGDLDGDGRDEVLTADADGILRCVNKRAIGRLPFEDYWTHQFDAPLYAVEPAHDDDGNPIVVAGGVTRELVAFSAEGEVLKKRPMLGAVRLIRSGNFHENPGEELFVVCLRGRPRGASVLDADTLEELVDFDDDSLPGSMSSAPECAVGDVDGDGLDEILVQEGAFRPLEKPDWVVKFENPKLPRPNYDFYYRSARYATGDFLGTGSQQLVTLLGPDLIVHHFDGRLVGAVRASRGFTDVARLKTAEGDKLVLGSSPNGDDMIYLLDLRGDWQRDLRDLKLQGRIAAVSAGIAEMSEQIEHWRGEPMAGTPGPYPIQIGSVWIDDPSRLWAVKLEIETVRAYEEDFPYDCLRFATVFWLSEDVEMKRSDGTPWIREHRLRYQLSREQIVDIARRMEEAKAHFWVQLGHGTAPYMTIEAAEEILKAAPTMCLGFVSAEDEQEEHIVTYLKEYVCPIMDACLRHGNRMFILREKCAWWAIWPTMPEVRELLFSGKYRSVLVPSVEDSNTRCPDIDLAARVGLWLNGEVDRWGCRMVADCFSFNRAWEWEYPMVGHPHLRYLTAHTALGASVFMIKVGQDTGPHQYTHVGREGVAPFLHMLGKGVLRPPRPDQFASLSPVVIQTKEPTDRFMTSAHNGHHYERFTPADLEDYAFSRLDNFWGMTNTPENDLSRIAWGRTRQFGNFIPRTDSGYVAVLPGPISDEGRKRWQEVWATDGDVLRRPDGTSLGLAEDSLAFEETLSRHAAEFPLKVEPSGFCQLIRQSPYHVVLIAADPNYLDPKGTGVRVLSNKLRLKKATDRLSGKELLIEEDSLHVSIRSGALTIVDIEVE